MAGGPFAGVPAALPPRVFTAVRVALFVLALAPFAELVRLGVTGGLGANPVEFVLRWLGTWTLVTLLATLAITPLRWVTGWAWLIRLRRMLGLYAFFYGTLHVASYVWIDHFFDWA
ncbi:MAG: sulfoxide reductase heme-binding subunit YedZ, partial [Betaproteobacteria bacterium]